MKNSILSFFCILLCCLNIMAQCDGDWVNGEGAEANETIWDLTIDDEQNVYTIGYFDSTTFIGGNPYQNETGTIRIFLQKHDANGNLLWTKVPEMTGSSLTLGQSIHHDGNNLYVSFPFSSEVVYNGNVISASTGGILLLKLNSDGDLIWEQVFETTQLGPYIAGITTDSQGDIIVTGRFRVEMTLDETIISSSLPVNRAFIVKLDADGNYIWDQVDQKSLFSRGWPIAVDDEDNIVFGGYFVDSLQIGDGSFFGEPNMTIDYYIAKYSPDGEPIWINGGNTAGQGFSHPYDLSISNGAVWVTGAMGDTIETDGQTFITGSPGEGDAFLARYDLEDGSLVWFNNIGAGDIGGEWGTGVFQRSDGNIVWVGQLFPNPLFDGDTLNTGTALDIYTAVFDETGTFISAASTNIENNEATYATALGDNDELYIGGAYLADEAVLGCNSIMSSNNSENAFLWNVSMADLPTVVSADYDFNLSADPQVVFMDASLNDPVCYEWTIGGDSVISSEASPIIIFEEADNYVVCLEVSNCFSNDIICKSLTVDLLGVPVPSFTYEIDGLTVAFMDQSQNNPNGWIWIVEDFDMSIEQNPSFTFPEAGTYEVCLTALNDAGAGMAYCETIMVSDTMMTDTTMAAVVSAAFTYEVDAETNSIYTFNNISENASSYLWTFGADSLNSSEENPSFTFSEEGDYEVCLIATDSLGVSDTFCETISVMFVGVEQLGYQDIKLSPQPMTDYVQFILPESNNFISTHTLSIYSILGQKMDCTYKVNEKGWLMERSELPTGTYFYVIEQPGEINTQIYTGKLMVL